MRSQKPLLATSTSLAMGAIFGIAISTSACNGKISQAECSQMLDKYVDLAAARDPALEQMSDSEKQAVREMARAVKKTEPAFARAQKKCEVEVSRREYDCAMKAPNADRWEACID